MHCLHFTHVYVCYAHAPRYVRKRNVRIRQKTEHAGYVCSIFLDCSSSSSSRNEYYLGGIIALLLQDHRTMSTESVCSSQYMVTDQH